MSHKHILIVEDDQAARESLKLLLELEGFQVYAAENGRAALDVISDLGQPCLIVLDLMMPVMSGWEFLAALEARDGGTLTHSNIVVVSAVADLGSSELLQNCRFLSKPFDVEPILDFAEECCK